MRRDGNLHWTESGAQPLVNDEQTVSLAVNGEIYNHRILRKSLKKPYNFKTHSDCEVIIPLVRATISGIWGVTDV
ncbi:AsnB Asparagine synthase glutamine-hydrolyzing [Pyrenophora tritici-repentis]|nr:Asparagine synthetase [Pyrenophora tritici-repentis]KAF7447634.1 Asparagine synthetase [Pyrenophora tritici-repentis]KAG9385440.1 Asparagine synthetase [Pyrenophora tritici-repentis]KAI1554769.1 AsnB Asparagine synthase glutamine-hydrolyzing [Pyrenophora tritici-repentis]KAI1567894.1 AsnB Asparagine synthase glutamine-hydrolyzing [Pyrenophora tritici-repentis]